MVIKEISDIIFMYNLHMKVLNTTSFNVHILSLHLFWWSHLGILFSSSYFHRWYRLASDISVMSFSWQHFFVLCTFNKTWAPIIKVSAAGWQVPYTDTCVKTTTFYGFIQLLRSRWSRCLSDLKSLEMGLMWTCGGAVISF